MNAKEELLDSIPKGSKIKCAQISHYYTEIDPNTEETTFKSKYFKLVLDHNEHELNMFMDSLDFNIDDSEDIDGCIWLLDGTWIERSCGRYYKYWAHCMIPEIRVCLMIKQIEKVLSDVLGNDVAHVVVKYL